MDATQVFIDLLRSIEDSQLNYSMSRTPFSATISLKCSFLKRFAEASQISDVEKVVNLPRKDFQVDKKVKESEAEKVRLQAEIDQSQNPFDIDQKKLMEELVKLQQVFDNETERSKAIEMKISEFREEILKIKNQKQKSNVNLKQKQDECEAHKDKTKGLTEENKGLQKVIKDKIRVLNLKDAEHLKTKREYETVKKDFIKIETELDNLKLNMLKKAKSVNTCEKCDTSIENYEEFKVHNIHYHSYNKASQYEKSRNFQKFNCFYCDTTINSIDNLEAHSTICHNEFDGLMEPPAIYPQLDSFLRDICEAKCEDMDEMERHWSTHHCLGIGSEDLGSVIFQCDIWPLYFEMERDLEFHKRGCHWEHL